jgi:HAD superfamily hydrolase (TIGR01509 family)
VPLQADVKEMQDHRTSYDDAMPDRCVLTTVLCDADGNLFDSEVPAFEASVEVTNRFLAALGSRRRYDADTLRKVSLGRNFRRLASDLAVELGEPLSDEDLADWVAQENAAVTRHLAGVLRPDDAVTRALRALGGRYDLAVVTSSALPRLNACLSAADLEATFPEAARFSAQDSLPVPSSKPDPAVYQLALRTLGLRPDQAIAVEDAEAGVASAVGAGIAVVGNLVHVPVEEQAARRDALLAAGAIGVVADWAGLVALLAGGGRA